MLSALLSRVISLGLGTLYPAYASYKAVRTKNVKEYVKWMMYWIVFALFTSVETISDVFLSWFPFYYEIKIIFLIWLLSPATKGSSLLYRKFVHPQLLRRENKIDEMIVAAQTRSYDTAVQLGQKSMRYVTSFIMDQAVRAPAIMQELISSSDTGAPVPPPAPRYQPATIREITEEETQAPARPVIELSDDEMAEDVPASNSADSVDSVDSVDALMEVSGGSEEAEVSGASSRRGRRKKIPTDITFSSGGESDDPEFQPVPVKEPKKAGTRKTSTRAARTRKTKN